MRVAVIFITFIVIACAAPRRSAADALAIEGIWISDRALTLAELQKAQSWTPRQWAMLSAPDFFGQMVNVFRGNKAMSVYEGKCGEFEEFEVLEASTEVVRIRFLKEQSDGDQEVTFRLVGGHLQVPIRMFESHPHEVFRRVSPEEAVRAHPCLATVVDTPGQTPQASR